MADKGNSSQLKRWLAALFAALCLCTVITPVDAQQRDETRRTEPTGAPATTTTTTTTTTVPEPAPDRTGDTGAVPEATAPEGTEEVRAEVISGASGVAPEIDLARPRRTKSERPYYFTAQYVQRFDDNILLRSDDVKGDIVYIPTIGFGVERVRPRSLVLLDFQGGGEILQRFTDLSGALINLNLVSEYDLSRRTLAFLTERFVRRPLTTGFVLLGPAGTPTSVLGVPTPTRTTVNDISGGLVHQLSRFSTVRTSYNLSVGRFSDPRLIDFNENLIEVGYTRKASRTRDYDIAYRFSRFTGDDTITTHTLLPTLGYRHRRGILLRVGAGPQLALTPFGNQVFAAGLADFTYATRNTVYGIAYSTGIGSGGGLAVATRNHTVFGTLDHAFNRKVLFDFRAGYTRSVAGVGSRVSPFVSPGFRNNSFIIENRLAYSLGNKLALFFEYSYTRQTSTDEVVNRNIFSLGINFDTGRSERSPRLRTGRF